MHRQDAPPPQTIGRYSITAHLGDGGMGVVYLGRDPTLERFVAIKLMRRGIEGADFHERFAREARAVASLRHPSIVTVFEYGHHDGQPFIVMEYITGHTLADLLLSGEPMSLGHRLRLAEDLCRGVHHAHQAGIIHRDVKPANVMVDDDGTLKILDFGIAKQGHGALTQLRAVLGTPRYMAPEQVDGGAVTHRADIFSVGLVIYELLSGRPAFPDGNVFAVMQGILHGAPTPLATFMPDIDPRLVAVVAKALEKKAEERYADLARMARDIRRLRLEFSAGDSYYGMTELPTLVLPRLGRTPPPTPALPIDERRSRVTKAFEARDFAGALVACEEALAVDPTLTWAQDGLAQARLELERARLPDIVDERAAVESVAGALDVTEPTKVVPPAVTGNRELGAADRSLTPAAETGAVEAPALGWEMFADRLLVEQHGRHNSVGVILSVTTHVVALGFAVGLAFAAQRQLPAIHDPLPMFVTAPPLPPPLPARRPPKPTPPSKTSSPTSTPTLAPPETTAPVEAPVSLPVHEPELPTAINVEPTVDFTPPVEPPPPPPGINEAPVTDYDRPAQVLVRALPQVPVGATGVVQVVITVRSDGTIARTRLLTETPFAEAILEAAARYRFRPAQRRGRPVPVEVVVEFKLSTLK